MKVTVVIAATADQPLPLGDTFGGYKYDILQGPLVVQTGTTADLTFVFPNDVPAGSYVASVTAVDPQGAGLANPVTTAFTVPESTATFKAPTSLTVSLQ